jgi:outer membrane protein assembly factor BamB
VGRFGRVVCLDAESGQLVWQKELTTDFGGRPPSWGYAPSPLIDGNTLILLPGGSRGNMVALDKVTGATRWQGGGTDGVGYATPAIATIGGVRQYVAMTAKAVIGVQPDNGQLLWRQDWVTSNDVNAAMPLVFNDQVFVTAGYNHGCGLVKVAANQPTVAWENKAIVAHFSSPVLLDGYIYGDSDPDHLVCLDPNTGEIKWRQPGFDKGGLTVVGGLIVAMSGRTGDVVLVDPQPTGYKELGRLKTMGGPNAWTAPVVAYGKLLVRNRTALACYDLN